MRPSNYGKNPSGQRLARIHQSPNFKNGRFQNQHFTPTLAEGYNFFGVTYEFLFKKNPRRRPTGIVPSEKTDLLNLPPADNLLVWFGHSSYFMQIDGKTMLVDPVFSGNASPVRGTNRAFKGADRYTVDDLPPIDYLFITHDHYDHLDHKTLLQLRGKVKKLFCGLGVGEHLEHWGYAPDDIFESDWNERLQPDAGFTIHALPTRHFSGRGFIRNKTLWLSFLLQTPSLKIYMGGDSGYDTHFAEIGERLGPIDLAILDNGQYDPKWKYIHMQPAETLQAAVDLKAKRLMPVHSSKFVLANHGWDEPLATIVELNGKTNIPLLTPRIGEVVELGNENQVFTHWWADLK